MFLCLLVDIHKSINILTTTINIYIHSSIYLARTITWYWSSICQKNIASIFSNRRVGQSQI